MSILNESTGDDDSLNGNSIINHASPLVSIIVVNYNGNKLLINCLRSILSTKYPNFEVILVDNGSIDKSMEVAQRIFGNDNRVLFIKNQNNLGFGEGNNVGVRKSRGSYIVFLNNDIEVDPQWLNELLDAVNRQENVGAAQCKLLSLTDKKKFDSAGDYITTLGFPFMRGKGEKDLGQFDKIDDIFSARGAAMIIKRNLFESAGGFDPLYFIQYEDMDLSWRIHLQGYRIIFVPKSVVFHADRASTSKMKSSEFMFNGWKGHLLTLLKNYDAKNLVRFNPIFSLFGGMVPDLFIRKDPISLVARLRALTWIVCNFKQVIKSRRNVQLRIRKVPDSEVMKFMLKSGFKESFFSSVKYQL